MRTCSCCGQPHSRGADGYCKSCHARYMRDNRRRYSELTPLMKLKANCRSYSKVLVKRGIIKREPCRVCGNPAAQIHHPDYGNPRKVEWYCSTCHRDLHRAGFVPACPIQEGSNAIQ